MVALYVKDTEEAAHADSAKTAGDTVQKTDWQAQKAEQARIRKLENTRKKAEERIEELEAEISDIDNECAKPEVATNSARLGELMTKQNACKKELEEQYEIWEEVSLELDG